MADDNRRAVTTYFLVLFIIILILLYRLFLPFFHTLIVGLILTGLFYPIYRRIKQIVKGSEILASLGTCLLVFLTRLCLKRNEFMANTIYFYL